MLFSSINHIRGYRTTLSQEDVTRKNKKYEKKSRREGFHILMKVVYFLGLIGLYPPII